jgi:ATP-binding cassette subfamily F protein 3
MLLGTIKVTSGHQYHNPRLRVSCFTQHHVDMLELSVTPIEQLRRQYPNEKEESYRAQLGTFSLKSKLQLTPIYMLSAGQKSRVAFAAAVYNNPHVLILDEPTNHLDLDLVTAIKSYSGGVLIVSHDEHLIKSVCTDIFYVKNGSF